MAAGEGMQPDGPFDIARAAHHYLHWQSRVNTAAERIDLFNSTDIFRHQERAGLNPRKSSII